MNNQQAFTFQPEDIGSPSPTYQLSSTDMDNTIPSPNTSNHSIIKKSMTKNQNSINDSFDDDHKLNYNHNHSLNDNNYDETTIEILISYGLPKTTEHYSSKGKSCPIDEYQQYIIQYFKINHITLEQFYKSTLNKSSFVSNMVKYIEDKTKSSQPLQLQTTPSLNPNNSSINDLPRALKQLYTIMQMSQYSNEYKGISANRSKSNSKNTSVQQMGASPSGGMVMLEYDDEIDPEELRRLYKERRRRSKRNDSMIQSLSESQSRMLELEADNKVLADISMENQQKLIDSEHKEDEYKQTVNKLENELKQEKTKINDISSQNNQLQHQLEIQKNEMMTVTKQLSGKLQRLQTEKQKLQELVFELQYEKNHGKIYGNNHNNNESPMKLSQLQANTRSRSQSQISVTKGIANKNYIETKPLKSKSNKTALIASQSRSHFGYNLSPNLLPSTNLNVIQSNEEYEMEQNAVSVNTNKTKHGHQKKTNHTLKIMDEDMIANLSKFYKNMDNDDHEEVNDHSEGFNYAEQETKHILKHKAKKRKLSFWERLFEEFQCVPSCT